MTKRKPGLANIRDCTGCMACVASCCVSALTKNMGEDGHVYVKWDAGKCIACMRCEEVCKVVHSLSGTERLNLSTPYAAWAKDEALRQRSTSGGFAAAAGRWFIKNGSGVAGASFDGRMARHILAADGNSLSAIQGSKYVWSDAGPVYHEIAALLPQKKVLFTGTGCQVAGVLAFFANHPFRDNLYTIDLICGGVPSDLLMQSFFASNPQLEAIISFRSKRKYELKGIVSGQEFVFPDNALPLAGFRSEQTMRFSCYNCQYACAHRASDITIGDLWGNAAPIRELTHGVSLVVVHTDKGRELLSCAEVYAHPIAWKDLLTNNGRLVFGCTPLTFLRKRLARNFQRMDVHEFERVYSLTSSIDRPAEFLFRIWLHLLRKVYTFKCQRTVKSILNQCE